MIYYDQLKKNTHTMTKIQLKIPKMLLRATTIIYRKYMSVLESNLCSGGVCTESFDLFSDDSSKTCTNYIHMTQQ